MSAKIASIPDTGEQINKSIKQCGKVLNKWLAEEQLYLGPDKSKKLNILLVHYFSEQETYSEEDILNLLRNLCGGLTDTDDIVQVEIEIQRLLGHTHPQRRHVDRRNLYLVVFIFFTLLALIDISLFSLSFKASSALDILKDKETHVLASQQIDPDKLFKWMLENYEGANRDALTKE